MIYEFYGATEGGGTLATPQDWLAHPGTVGRPWQGADIKVLDDAGNDVPAGTVGTVYMKMMGGDFRYKGDAEKTDASRQGDYFTVGDMGELDEDGFLFLRDRKIDMIISGGVNVYPAEVEASLLSHPAVGDAAVFGIPDEDWGEQVKAVVEPAPGHEATAELADALLAHCATELAKYKCPRSIDFTDAMHVIPTGSSTSGACGTRIGKTPLQTSEGVDRFFSTRAGALGALTASATRRVRHLKARPQCRDTARRPLPLAVPPPDPSRRSGRGS